MKPRLTVLGLMGLIACIGVGLAAARINDEHPTAVVFALTYFALCTSTVFAIYRRGAWAGFAIFGWAQFFICQPANAPSLGPTSLSNRIAYSLLVRYYDTGWQEQRSHVPYFTTAVDHEWLGRPVLEYYWALDGRHSAVSLRGEIPVHSLRVWLCLSCLLAGLVGAAVGRFVDRRHVMTPTR